jgi:hypothetical protein
VSKSEALVKRGETQPAKTEPKEPAPPMVLARSLEEAPPRAFVHVDNQGRVRSPARYRALQAISYGAAGTLVIGVTAFYGALLGIPGVAVGVGLSAWLAWHIRRGRKVEEATRLIVHDRLDEAQALLESVLRSWRCPRPLKALAEQNLAMVFIRRGEFEKALERQRAAMVLYARSRSKSVFARTVEYAEVVTLVNLGRVGEARQRLEQRGPAPKGDYLRLQHWVAELYVCLAEGEHRLTADDLHERARAALAITGAAALLGLSAWAHAFKGDTDQAWHLLREAFDRREAFPLERGLPKLYEWMRAHAAEAGIDPNAAVDEDAAAADDAVDAADD